MTKEFEFEEWARANDLDSRLPHVEAQYRLQVKLEALRDQFAGQAMHAIYMRLDGPNVNTQPEGMARVAKCAYDQAGAMIAERGRATPGTGCIGGAQPIAPWPDFAGNPIRHGDRLAHPTGEEFTAVWLKGHEDEGDAWRAVYDNATVSRLGLQIGDKGQAVRVSGEKS